MCSHRSKLELIHAATAAGYYVALHVVMVPVELSVARVHARVAAGGHDVPEVKIRERFERLWPIVADAVPMCDTATCWDNSRSTGPDKVAQFIGGMTMGPPKWPTWAPQVFVTRWASAP